MNQQNKKQKDLRFSNLELDTTKIINVHNIARRNCAMDYY